MVVKSRLQNCRSRGCFKLKRVTTHMDRSNDHVHVIERPDRLPGQGTVSVPIRESSSQGNPAYVRAQHSFLLTLWRSLQENVQCGYFSRVLIYTRPRTSILMIRRCSFASNFVGSYELLEIVAKSQDR
ncbi:hypothetical protein Mapa_014665 [Marchantia paleacea]|nr:hypothetical protein Mapa_014665 [Marchantia paleacea]